jgi:hypothetical protein
MIPKVTTSVNHAQAYEEVPGVFKIARVGARDVNWTLFEAPAEVGERLLT